jgi:uncharacterized membrane protein YphA (DoxX/SURF4 family)
MTGGWSDGAAVPFQQFIESHLLAVCDRPFPQPRAILRDPPAHLTLKPCRLIPRLACAILSGLESKPPRPRPIFQEKPKMSSPPIPAPRTSPHSAATLERLALLYGRIALGVAFLSGIADRFGLYTGRNVGYGNFAGFERYTAQVNSFMPASSIPFLAWAATAAELFFGVALIFGLWLRWVALGSALLLVLFGTAMAISFGIKSPLDYSVFSASAAAVMLAVFESRKQGAQS